MLTHRSDRNRKPYLHDVFIGTAAWTIPRAFESFLPAEGSHLERYASFFRGVEINSSFYRDHQPKTYARWAATVPKDFRFAVKLSREITHDLRLQAPFETIESKLAPIRELGEKLGVVLVQLPPSLAFDPRVVRPFLERFRSAYAGPAAIEPRHASWMAPSAHEALKAHQVTKVIADPERCPSDDFSLLTAGGFYYFRLHGSPEIYRSEYREETLRELGGTILRASSILPGWCIFDNTTFGYATRDAFRLATAETAEAVETVEASEEARPE